MEASIATMATTEDKDMEVVEAAMEDTTIMVEEEAAARVTAATRAAKAEGETTPEISTPRACRWPSSLKG